MLLSWELFYLCSFSVWLLPWLLAEAVVVALLTICQEDVFNKILVFKQMLLVRFVDRFYLNIQLYYSRFKPMITFIWISGCFTRFNFLHKFEHFIEIHELEPVNLYMLVYLDIFYIWISFHVFTWNFWII